MAWAAGEEAATFLGPIVALLVTAGVIGFICARFRIVPIVGFLLAGVVIGPHQFGLVPDQEVVTVAAEIGVMLLLFTIGIEFSLERLLSIKRFVLVGGTAQVLLTIAVVTGIVLLFGQSWQVGVFTGFLVALSSTAIVLKILSAKGLTARPVGQASVGALILQDLAIIVMVLLIPVLAGTEGSSGVLGVGQALGTAALVLAGVLIVSRKVIPPLLERVARLCSPEIFLLAVAAIALGTAFLTSLAGVSDALGAFLAGLVLAESRHSAHALSEIMPLQMIFSAVFFVSIGMLLDLRVLLELWWLVLVLATAVVAIKLLTTSAALTLLRVGAPTTLASAFMLAQIGEFSFVLQQAGSGLGLTPGGLGDQGGQLLIAVTVLLMTLTPVMAALGEVMSGRARRRAPADPSTPPAHQRAERDHVLIAGWGPVARRLGAVLRARGVSVTVTTLSPDLAAEAEAEGHAVVRGLAAKEAVLHEVGIDTVDLIVISESAGEETTHLAEILHHTAPGVPIVARPTDFTDVTGLQETEAVRVVDPQQTAAAPLARSVLEVLGRTEPEGEYPDPTRIVDFAADPATACQHAASIRAVLPRNTGCTDCRRAGRNDWVHLRTCLGCGHVGCCDSSPGRHASQHADLRSHPIVASAEPDENWAWCYLDLTTLHAREDTGDPKPA